MVQNLDLEEQEQLDQLKHFWTRYGNLITWLLIVAFGAVAAWNGWQYWQHKQAIGASVLFDEIERAVADKDPVRTERAFSDIKGQYGGTVFAQQGALLAARGLTDAAKPEQAKVALEWAAGQKSDEGLQAVARLRLAGLALDMNAPADAQKWLDGITLAEFASLVADRMGDVQLAQGQRDLAKASYLKAYQGMDEKTEYRRLVEVKLNALGVDPSVAASAAVEKSK
jgi:predicted negative regulator of RcsB-dependent stress response